MNLSSKTAITLIVLIMLSVIVAAVTFSKYMLEKHREEILEQKLSKLTKIYTSLKIKYNELKSEYKELYSNYSELKEEFEELSLKYSNITAQIANVKNLLNRSKVYEQKVREILLPIPSNELYVFTRTETHSGYVEATNFTWYYLGTLHKGDQISISVTPSKLIIALTNSTKIVALREGYLSTRINETDKYFILVYNREAWPENFVLRVTIKKIMSPETLFGDNSIESRILFKIVRAYNYWYYDIKNKLKEITNNATELSILYAVSLAELLRSLGFNVKYAVIGKFPIIRDDSLSLIPESIIPVVIVNGVNGDKISTLIRTKLDKISEFLGTYDLIWKHSPIMFKLYIDTFSIAYMDLNESKSFIPFAILYEER